MKNLSTVQALIIVSQIGFAFAAAVAVGLFAGGYLDSLLHTSPIFVVVGALAGTAAGIYSAVQLARFGTGSNKSD
jgi:F0F1-type ATP synthase assembly protein I